MEKHTGNIRLSFDPTDRFDSSNKLRMILIYYKTFKTFSIYTELLVLSGENQK
jgi:hypothetical protein